MSDVREIRRHIESVQDTEKVTNAMYMIAATRMQKAKQRLDATRPFFEAMRREIKRVFRVGGDIESVYLYPEGEVDLPGDYGYLVITSDKGLAGSFNQSVLKEAKRHIETHSGKVYMMGEYGRRAFTSQGIPFEKSFTLSNTEPSLKMARKLAKMLLNAYLSKEISKIYIVYTDMKSGISQTAYSLRLLPFHRDDWKPDEPEKEITTPFVFYPSMEEVLNASVESYLTGIIYSCLVDSYCSEQSARMNAMDEANTNADKLLMGLRTQYNHARQAKITKEITEISSGAKALKKKKVDKERRIRNNER